MHVLVTGGAGFIGSHLVDGLLADGARVRVLDNLATGRAANLAAAESRIEWVRGDVRDRTAVAAAAAGVDAILHAAALPSVIGSIEDPATSNDVNATGTLNVLLAARGAGVRRIVFSSSSSIYGDSPALPKIEDMTPRPMSPYALQKLTGEHYMRMFHELYGLETFSLRYFNVFGPRQNPRSQYAAVVPLFVKGLLEGRRLTVYGDGEQTRDFTFVSDIVAANRVCLKAPREAAGGVYNIACGERISVNRLARELAAIAGKPCECDHAPDRPGEVRDSQADFSLAERRLAWRPSVPFAEGLRQTFRYYAGGGA
jgi:nucleoside-diphosphate-sugar epimerase